MLNLRQKFLEFIIGKLIKQANVFYLKHQYGKAISLYQKILKLNPQHYGALGNLAAAYFESGEYLQALPLFLQLQKKDSTNPWWHTYLSQIYQKQKSFRKALDAAWRAVKTSHGAMEHQINLSYALYEISLIKRNNFVKKYAAEFYAQYPNSGIARQCYNTFFTADSSSCDLEYIEKIFDVFAPEFEKVLASLNYNSPNIIARELQDLKPRLNTKSRILDLGCGSGLCAQAVKQIFPKASLFGVDISSQMLKIADSKNIYSHLSKANIIDYLSINELGFDVVIASDVFTYFGKLDELFELIFKRLNHNGIFIFTISQNNTNRQSYFLNSSSRFTHSFSYVKKVLQKTGFHLQKNVAENIRFENGKPVNGGIFIALKK